MKYNLSEEHLLIQNNARDFATNELLPGAIERDEKKIWPKDAVKSIGEMGFLGIMLNQKWCGAGMDPIAYTLVMEEIAKADASASVILSVNNSLVCSLIEKYLSLIHI